MNEKNKVLLQLFLNDTTELAEKVVLEEDSNPETSAVTFYKRFQLYNQIMSELKENDFCENVELLINKQGYDTEFVNGFLVKREKELPHYHGEVEWNWK